MPLSNPRQFLFDIFTGAVASVSAEKCLPAYLPAPPQGRTVVVGAGKAAAAMAKAVEAQWSGELSGLVVTRYGHGADCQRIEVVEAAHPVPDDAGRYAARRILQMVQGLTADDLVLCLISGGGSSLLTLPADGISLEQKQALNKALLKSGAAIDEMNCVRKHLSMIKGGRLALACAPARVVTLLISDVPGDDPAIIASGPTLPDATTCEQALAILRKYAIA
jgi:hydroxypyruvate reductase